MRASVSAAFNESARRKDKDARKDARLDPREEMLELHAKSLSDVPQA